MCFKTMSFFPMNNFSIWNWNSCWIGMNSWDCSCEIRAANPNWVDLRIFTSAVLRSLWKLTVKTGIISNTKLFRSPTHLRSNLISYEIKLIDWNSSLWDWLECLKVGEKIFNLPHWPTCKWTISLMITNFRFLTGYTIRNKNTDKKRRIVE